MLGIVILLLSGMTILGSFSVAGWTPRPVRLFADLTKGLHSPEDDFPNDSLLWAQIQIPESDPVKEDVPAPVQNNFALPQEDRSDTPASDETIVPVEDFSANGDALRYFFLALEQRNDLERPVRVAFLGDSFVEGDILTSDLRESLQSRYGGRGVGFVPLAPIDRYRNTLNVEHEGWGIRSSLYGEHKARYLFNGQCFYPELGEAFTAVRTTGQREHAKAFNTASLLYSADSTAALRYRLGGGEERETTLRSDGSLQLFTAKRTNMQSASFRVSAGEDFSGYGLFLNDETGVCVDNYALRSSSGMQLLRIGPNLLTRMNRLIPYDLIVIQYGMNVMEAERKDYDSYADQMVRVVNRLREAIPEASILIFGVGDRNFKNEEGEMVTKVGVVNLVDAQRRVAQETGVAFWNTYLAMGGRNSMGQFVNHDPPLANKDYTHINYPGGKRIAYAFINALENARRYTIR